MPRRKNVVSKAILNIGRPADLAKVIRQNEQMASRLGKPLVNEVLQQTKRNVKTRVVKWMLVQLAIYPARQIGMKVDWTSKKQQRYVIMLLRKKAEKRLGRKLKPGESFAYKRTGRYGRNWKADVVVDERAGTLRIITENTAENAGARGKQYKIHPFIQGNIGLGKSRRSAGRYNKPIQRFHLQRGWRPASPIIQDYYGRAAEEAETLYRETAERRLRRR